MTVWSVERLGHPRIGEVDYCRRAVGRLDQSLRGNTVSSSLEDPTCDMRVGIVVLGRWNLVGLEVLAGGWGKAVKRVGNLGCERVRGRDAVRRR